MGEVLTIHPYAAIFHPADGRAFADVRAAVRTLISTFRFFIGHGIWALDGECFLSDGPARNLCANS